MVSYFYTECISGHSGIPRQTMMLLFGEAYDVRGLITAWSVASARRKIFHPKHEIPYETLGSLFGTFFLGYSHRNQRRMSYTLHGKETSKVLDILELVGALEKKPEVITDSRDLEEMKFDLRVRFGCNRSDPLISYTITVPYQFTLMTDMVLANLDDLSQNPYFCRAALKAWLDEKASPFRKRDTHKYSAYAYMSIEPRSGYRLSQEHVIRK